mmetsp:Transcript_24646/g.54185  ORF Transcript_24646/g.54185 Transcript_24646/m.54185 type:complete len:255 (+) Transcript_24646:516-1280(+)
MAASAMTSAAMPSTRGGARGRTQGSCRPLVLREWGSPLKVTVSCAVEIEEAGLIPILITMWWPVEMPPSVPPALLVAQRRTFVPPCSLAQASTNRSLCSLPFIRQALNPAPISKALVAGRDIIALARSASSLSKQGSPRPIGALEITQVITPPVESWAMRRARMRAAILAAVAKSGHLVWAGFPSPSGVMVLFSPVSASYTPPFGSVKQLLYSLSEPSLSTWARVGGVASRAAATSSGRSTSCTPDTQATTLVP